MQALNAKRRLPPMAMKLFASLIVSLVICLALAATAFAGDGKAVRRGE